MPNSVSAKKRLRQSLSRRARNRAGRSAIRTQIRKVRAAIAAGDATACETEFRFAVKKLDQAASKNILHANSAARIKSRLSKAIKAVKDKRGAPAKAK
jgi:small subunit ribosomal protein S20